MKKIFFFIGLLCISSQNFAQTSYLMPKFGLSFARQNYSDGLLNSFGFAEKLSKDNIKFNRGFTYGVAYVRGITDEDDFLSFTLQPELIYTQKGIRISYQDNTFREKEQRYFSYLELPISGKLVFGTENLKGFIYGGPAVGYVISGKYKYQSQCDCDNYVETREGSIKYEDAPARYAGSDVYAGKDGVSRIDFGVQGGIGFSYTVGDLGMIMFDTRYGTGFTNFYKKYASASSGTDLSSKNRALTFSIGFAFNLDN
jgi:hypothetical protein